MPVPILLVTGFLGAGKTTLVNHVLAQAQGRRIAAVVNDFGAINIDAELIAGASDGVISLANGCICCSLEGDLLRTLATLLRRTPQPEAIIIETSGAADPGEVVRSLLDPVIRRAAPLEAVLCVLDSAAPVPDDALVRAQLRAADIVALTKGDLAAPATAAQARTAALAIHPRAAVIDALHGRLPMDLLFPEIPGAPPPRALGPPRPRRLLADRFETVTWTWPQPLSLPRVQAAIGQVARRLVRAKGIIETLEHPGRPMLLQFAGGRATLDAAGPVTSGLPPVRLVFIFEIGALCAMDIVQIMERSADVPPQGGAFSRRVEA